MEKCFFEKLFCKKKKHIWVKLVLEKQFFHKLFWFRSMFCRFWRGIAFCIYLDKTLPVVFGARFWLSPLGMSLINLVGLISGTPIFSIQFFGFACLTLTFT